MTIAKPVLARVVATEEPANILKVSIHRSTGDRLVHELAHNTLVETGKALELEAQLCGECSPDCDRLVR
jgi:hypothetical protein